MKRLDIQITKAALESFSVELREGKPRVTASIALLTEGGKKITDYTISTNHWEDEQKFDLPMECIEPIVVIARQLEAVVTRHCRDTQRTIEAKSREVEADPEPQEEPAEGQVVVLDHLDEDDDEIDLDSIPF